MAGGNFTLQNKIRPGVYINFNSAYQALGTIGERGTVLLPLVLPFGEEHKGITVERDTNVFSLFGLDSGSTDLLLLREAAKKAQKVVVYRLNSGQTASASLENFQVEAAFSGSLGNKLSVLVTALEAGFEVASYLGGEKIDSQQVSALNELKDNAFLRFGGSALSAGTAVLSGGTDGTADWDRFFTDAKTIDFDTAAIPSEETAVKEKALSFVKTMREEEGKKIQIVAADMAADYEGVISVKNGVMLSGGQQLSNVQATAYVAGMTAGSEVNQSNTYAYYEGAVQVTERYTGSQIEALLKAGQMVFVPKGNKVLIEQDINSFVSFTADKGKVFSKNRLIRVLDSIGNDVKEIFEGSYIGKVNNNADGRRLLQSEILHYLQDLEQLGAVTGVKAEDIEISQGESKDSVIICLLVQPVDSMEKLYMTVTAE